MIKTHLLTLLLLLTLTPKAYLADNKSITRAAWTFNFDVQQLRRSITIIDDAQLNSLDRTCLLALFKLKAGWDDGSSKNEANVFSLGVPLFKQAWEACPSLRDYPDPEYPRKVHEKVSEMNRFDFMIIGSNWKRVI